ncbi:MAG: hypothetical protein Q7T62_06480 [Undibacterium sp.]|nr:hypothetical protein [Undibacterium sp.]
MNTANNRILTRPNTALLNVTELIKTSVKGIDRVKLAFDHPCPDIPLAAIQRYCKGEIKPIVHSNSDGQKYHPERELYLDFHQPSIKALKQLYRATQGRYKVTPYYLELALDLIPYSSRECSDHAILIRDFILGHMKVRHLSCLVTRYETSYYYSPRSIDGTQVSRNVVAYADRPSKLWGSRSEDNCCHIEHRFYNGASIANLGIHCLGDLVHFQFNNFWSGNFNLFDLLSKTKIPTLLEPETIELSGTALRNRATAILMTAEVDGVFVLQNLIRRYPNLIPHLTPMRNASLILA